MKGVNIIMVTMIVAVISAVAHEAVTCDQVNTALAPCIIYLIGHEGRPSPKCCSGVKAVKEMAQTRADKRACCRCVKAAAACHADLKDVAAQSMPSKCGVQLDIPVSRDLNCDTIN